MAGNLMLLVCAFIWGTAFVAQSEGMNYIGPFTFTALRSFVSGIVLLLVMPVLKRIAPDVMTEPQEDKAKSRKRLLLGGLLCGSLLFIASSFQQIGLVSTSAGKSGFITALYIVLVPLFGIFLKKKVGIFVWFAIVVAVAGLYLLSIKENLTIETGDLLTLGCAVFFSFHILTVDRISPSLNGVKLSCVQFFVCGLLALIPMFVLERPDLTSILRCAVPILYAGVLSGSIAYTLQILGQQRTDATIASMLMSLESVFAALAGWVVLHERLSVRELFGCLLIFIAVLFAQLPIEDYLRKRAAKK